jgi:hypothetical protein
MSRGGSWNVLAVLIAFSLFGLESNSGWSQELKLSRKERQLVRTVDEGLERASRFYSSGKFDD